MGGTGIAAGAGTVTVHLPTGVTGGRRARFEPVELHGASPLACQSARRGVGAPTCADRSRPTALRCRRADRGAPTVGSRWPSSWRRAGGWSRETVTVPFTVQRPPRWRSPATAAATVAVGSPATVPLTRVEHG